MCIDVGNNALNDVHFVCRSGNLPQFESGVMTGRTGVPDTGRFNLFVGLAPTSRQTSQRAAPGFAP